MRSVGWMPIASEASEMALLVVERRLRRRLPSAFRELMALENGPDLLAHFSNEDWPIPPDQLAEPLVGDTGIDPLTEHLLPFMIENQNVCQWAIQLDAGDDPPVAVRVDDQSSPDWQRCAERFSDWLKCQIRDSQLLAQYWFAAQVPPLTAIVLSALRERFEEGLQTRAWPGETNYRLSNARSQILLWSTTDHCDWKVLPRSGEMAAAALDEIDAISGVGSSLYALTPSSESVLRRWKDARAESSRS
jgi:hypothetical protein